MLLQASHQSQQRLFMFLQTTGSFKFVCLIHFYTVPHITHLYKLTFPSEGGGGGGDVKAG